MISFISHSFLFIFYSRSNHIFGLTVDFIGCKKGNQSRQEQKKKNLRKLSRFDMFSPFLECFENPCCSEVTASLLYPREFWLQTFSTSPRLPAKRLAVAGDVGLDSSSALSTRKHTQHKHAALYAEGHVGSDWSLRLETLYWNRQERRRQGQEDWQTLWVSTCFFFFFFLIDITLVLM